MGGSPKALQQHLAGETSLLGDYRSPTAVARVPSDIMRETAGTLKPALSMSSRAKVQSQPRSRPRWGNGRSRAQWICQTAPGLDESFNLVEGREHTLQEFFLNAPLEKRSQRESFSTGTSQTVTCMSLLPEARRREDGE